MSQKVALLKAVRDELKAVITAVANRVYVVVQDAQGNQLLPIEAEAPFLTVADGGLEIEWMPGQTGLATYRVNVRAYIQDLRDVETPVLGHAASGAKGAAELQDLVGDALQGKLLAARIAGVELAQVERVPQIDTVSDESWFAVIGDIVMRYEMSEA
jgi:hypothetical protein